MTDVVTGKLDVRPSARQLSAEPIADVPTSEPDDSSGEADLEPEAADAE